MTTNNADSIGVKVDDTSTINFAGTNNISTKGTNSTGLLLESGATATGAFTGTITTNGNNSAGIESASAASQLSVVNSTVTTLGRDSMGIRVEAGQVSVEKTTIKTTGDGSDGFRGDGSTSRVELTDSVIETAGAVSHGVLVDSEDAAAEWIVADSRISTTGDLSEGLRVRGSIGRVFIVNNVIETTGESGSGGVTVEVGNVYLRGSRISTTGSGSDGVKVQNSGTFVDIHNMGIETTGEGSAGVRVNDTGRVNFAGTNSISSIGSNGAAALWVEGFALVTGTLTGSVVANDADALMFEDTSVNTKTFALASATVSSPTNAILLKAGDLAVTATDSIMTGDIKAEAGALLDLTMVGTDKAKSVLTGAILNARNVSINSSVNIRCPAPMRKASYLSCLWMQQVCAAVWKWACPFVWTA